MWPLLVIAALVFVFAGLAVFFPVTVWHWRHVLAFKNPEDVEPSDLAILSQIVGGLAVMIMLVISTASLLTEDVDQSDYETPGAHGLQSAQLELGAFRHDSSR